MADSSSPRASVREAGHEVLIAPLVAALVAALRPVSIGCIVLPLAAVSSGDGGIELGPSVSSRTS